MQVTIPPMVGHGAPAAMAGIWVHTPHVIAGSLSWSQYEPSWQSLGNMHCAPSASECAPHPAGGDCNASSDGASHVTARYPEAQDSTACGPEITTPIPPVPAQPSDVSCSPGLEVLWPHASSVATETTAPNDICTDINDTP